MTTQTEQTTEYHYIVTVAANNGSQNTRDGILSLPTDYTRAQAFRYVMGQLIEEYGTPILVFHFSLEPNQL